jgi:hypothetical protein
LWKKKFKKPGMVKGRKMEINMSSKERELLKGYAFNLLIDKKRHVYLAGNISEDPRTREWREEFTEKLCDSLSPTVLPWNPRPIDKLSGLVNHDIHVINPCADRFNDQELNASDGLELTKMLANRAQNIFRARDYQLIKHSDLVVVHLGYSSKEKPMVGTIQELAWARDVFYVPVIAITGGEDNVYTRHPWINECCSAKVETVDEAVEFVVNFFI